MGRIVGTVRSRPDSPRRLRDVRRPSRRPVPGHCHGDPVHLPRRARPGGAGVRPPPGREHRRGGQRPGGRESRLRARRWLRRSGVSHLPADWRSRDGHRPHRGRRPVPVRDVPAVRRSATPERDGERRRHVARAGPRRRPLRRRPGSCTVRRQARGAMPGAGVAGSRARDARAGEQLPALLRQGTAGRRFRNARGLREQERERRDAGRGAAAPDCGGPLRPCRRNAALSGAVRRPDGPDARDLSRNARRLPCLSSGRFGRCARRRLRGARRRQGERLVSHPRLRQRQRDPVQRQRSTHRRRRRSGCSSIPNGGS